MRAFLAPRTLFPNTGVYALNAVRLCDVAFPVKRYRKKCQRFRETGVYRVDEKHRCALPTKTRFGLKRTGKY